MEAAILRKIGERWRNDERIQYFCHDKDSSSMAVLRQDLHWDLIERFDRNHVFKTWERIFNECRRIPKPPAEPNAPKLPKRMTRAEPKSPAKPKRTASAEPKRPKKPKLKPAKERIDKVDKKNPALKKRKAEQGKPKKPRRRWLTVLDKDIKTHLLKWFRTVLKMDATIAVRRTSWMKAYAHYAHISPSTDIPSSKWQWEGKAEPLCRQALKSFVEQTAYLIEQCQSKFSTQANESLHALKGKLAPKNFAWQSSWAPRCCVGILDWNEGESWKMEMYHELGFPPLSPDCVLVLENREKAKADQRRERATPEYHTSENERRQRGKVAREEEKRVGKLNKEKGHLGNPFKGRPARGT
jgi:hypothetical protein